MSSPVDLIASFAPGASHFAFQSNGSQKNFVDLYPLDPSNNYKVNSSLVNRIDYESNDLRAADIKFLTWCSGSPEEKSQKIKRKYGDNGDDGASNNTASKSENFFVNIFPKGLIVIYSPNGKDIVNIIQNKREILGVDSDMSSLWILDDDKTVKHFKYDAIKPIKTFHLVDGKDEEVSNFQILHFGDVQYLAVITEQVVYIIDPSKRRPTTVANLPVFGCICCEPVDDKNVAVANIESVSIYDIKSGEVVQSWKYEAEKLKVIGDYIFALGVDGSIRVFQQGVESSLSTIKVQGSEIIDFISIDSNIIISWLNVNEPNFETVTYAQVSSTNVIVFNETEKKPPKEPKSEPEPELSQEKKPKKKVSKTKQEELSNSLTEAFEGGAPSKKILKILVSENWTEHRIECYVRDELSEQQTNILFDILTKTLTQNAWSTSPNLFQWLKWTLTLRRPVISSLQSENNKSVKHLRSSLKASNETFPVLLSMQGKLEMLKAQAKLRNELTALSLEDGDVQVDVVNQEQDGDDENKIIYANGEGDDFVDALEYKD